MAFEKQLNDQSSLAKEIEEVKKQMYLKNDYILQVLDYSVEVQKSLCSTQYILRVFMECPEKSLKQLTMLRKDLYLKS
jgi:hypothetical protein